MAGARQNAYSTVMTVAPPTTAILLATRNGAPFLQAQLDSIAAQRAVPWRLIASDDGSTDDTVSLLNGFAQRFPGKVTVLAGPRQGASANFLHLIGHVAPGEALAFCDQDDVWLEDKLARAWARLATAQGPALYGASTLISDAALRPQKVSRRFARPLRLENVLVQVPFGGNTMLANPAAVALLQQGATQAAALGVVSHDWWTALVVSACGGALLRDEDPVLLYRQHDGNEVGRNDTLRGMAARFAMLTNGRFGGWMARNLAALRTYDGLVPARNRAMLGQLTAALAQPGPVAAWHLWRLGLYRQTRSGSAALFLAAALGAMRIRAEKRRG